ncbi:MAG: hypothetical protein A2Y63_00815 [Candidatus Riflebacteria bacterium RBG_13_59_9]|nr:MAG: hypothetical protein A2Y63_00815 [Candidatus Riflebacteria bacterium RBG_13_59_9]
MQAVHVLGGVNLIDDFTGIEMVGQRELHQNAANARIAVERVYELDQLLPADGGFELVQGAANAQFLAGAHFAAHIDGACRVIPHLDNGKVRTAMTFRCELFYPQANPLIEFFGYDLARKNTSLHC